MTQIDLVPSDSLNRILEIAEDRARDEAERAALVRDRRWPANYPGAPTEIEFVEHGPWTTDKGLPPCL